MMDEKKSQGETQLRKPLSTQLSMDAELSDQDLELVVGGVSSEVAIESFQQLIGNLNQGGS